MSGCPSLTPWLSLFEARRTGCLPTCQFYESQLTQHRLSSLDLSLNRTIDVSVHSSGITDVDIETCESRYVLAGGADGTIYIHDLWETKAPGCPKFTAKVVAHIGRSSRHAHKYSIECVQWYPNDHGIFTTSGMDKYLKIWDTNALKPADKFHLEGKIHSHHLSPVARHHLIAVATNVNHVHLIDIKTGASTHELRGHQGHVFACQWSPRDANVLATGGSDKKIFLWDVRQSKSQLRSLDYNQIKDRQPQSGGIAHDGYVNGLKFTEDGLSLVSFGRDGRVRKWNVDSGQNLKAKFPTFLNKTKNFTRFDLCGDFLAVPSSSFIYILNLSNDTVIKELSGHYKSVNSCVFRKDFQELISAGEDRTILIWDANEETNKAFKHSLETGRQELPPLKTVTVEPGGDNLDDWSEDSDDNG